jgi:hypothetical protein
MDFDFDAIITLADFLLYRSSPTAYRRMVEEAREQKQSVKEIACRRATNILNSYSMRKHVIITHLKS